MTESAPEQRPSDDRRTLWIFVGFVLVAGFFLLTEHRAHAFQYLPYLLVLACPLMHFFHRHGGKRHRHGSTRGDKP